MKIEGDGSVTQISEGRFLPRFVRYFAACSILGGIALFVCGITLIFERTGGFFQITIAWALAAAAVSYGIYLLFLFPDVRVFLDKKNGKASITQKRFFDKQVRDLELRRITGLVVEKSEGSTGKPIFRIAFRTYRGEIIPLSGSWTEDNISMESDARKIHASLDSNCSLELPAAMTLNRHASGPTEMKPGERTEAQVPKSELPPGEK